MNFDAMNMFLSEGNVRRHLDHLRTMRLRYSIIEKSLPEIKGRSAEEIIRLGLGREIKDEILSLLWYIRSHECFFDSFTDRTERAKIRLRHYSSRERLIYDLYTPAKENYHGFLYIYRDRYGVVRYHFTDENDGAFISYQPILAIDLYEHAYFNDYGFNKDAFLKGALEYLDLARLNEDISS